MIHHAHFDNEVPSLSLTQRHPAPPSMWTSAHLIEAFKPDALGWIQSPISGNLKWASAGRKKGEWQGEPHSNPAADCLGFQTALQFSVPVTREWHSLCPAFLKSREEFRRLFKPQKLCAHCYVLLGPTNAKFFALRKKWSEPTSLWIACSLWPIWTAFEHNWLKFFQWWLLLSIKLRLNQRSRNFNWKLYPVSSLPSWYNLSELQAPLNSLI